MLESQAKGRLSLAKTGISALYGAGDIVAEYVDYKYATKVGAPGTFKNATDASRAVATVGGALLAEYMSGDAVAAAEIVHYSALPLLEKSVLNAVMKLTKSTSPFRAHGQLMIKRSGSNPGLPPSTLGGGNAGVVF